MAWIYLAESADSPFLYQPGSGQLPIVKLIDMQQRHSCHVCQMGSSHVPQSGMMCEHWQDDICLQLTSSLLDSRARTSVLQEMAQAWRESEAVYFGRSDDLQASYNPDSSSWKTSQQSLLVEGLQWLGPLPSWGMTVDGALYPLQPLERLISGKDGFYWPTPNTIDAKGGVRHGSGQKQLCHLVKLFPTPLARDYRHGGLPSTKRKRKGSKPLTEVIGGQLNPTWVEWLMGYPTGWTELKDWAMQWCRAKREKRSKSFLSKRVNSKG